MVALKKSIFLFTGFIGLFSFICLTATVTMAFNAHEVEQSYHGQLGYGTGLGMLGKWCALPNFNFVEEGEIEGWLGRNCGQCHIGAAWNPDKPEADCLKCHPSVEWANDGNISVEAPTIEKCYSCHKKDTKKRGDILGHDVHLASDPARSCQFCHPAQNHQIAKGRVIDTSEPTITEPVVNCIHCHSARPHSRAAEKGGKISEPDLMDQHCLKVACETCHIDIENRAASTLLSRDWTRFKNGQPISQYHQAGWKPEYKWYDNKGPAAAYNYLPILGYAERRDSEGAKIYPFNVIRVTWFIKSKEADLNDSIPVKQVKAAGKNIDPNDPSLLVTTQENMRAYDDPDDSDSEPDYPEATLITREINFNLSHGVTPKNKALNCTNCHGCLSLLDWKKLGYRLGDPWKTNE